MRERLLVVAVVALLSGCRSPRPAVAAGDSASAPVSVLADSMVLRMKDGAEIWLAAARPDTAASGAVCSERLFEVRRDDKTLPVPLLYTIGAPQVINDTTVRAALHRHCVPSAWYLVNTRTGQPVPDKP